MEKQEMSMFLIINLIQNFEWTLAFFSYGWKYLIHVLEKQEVEEHSQLSRTYHAMELRIIFRIS